MNNNKPPSTKKRRMSDMMEDLQEALDAFDALGTGKQS